jgi:hypothetical protein
MTSRACHSTILALCAIVLIGLGLYFILLRPPLLPEDVRYIGATLEQVQAVAPGFAGWSAKVFSVLGGYIMATGLLTLYIALTSFRQGPGRVAVVVGLAGSSSIVWMAAVNVLIDSDYKWPLLGVAALWLAAVAWPWIERAVNGRDERHKEMVR